MMHRRRSALRSTPPVALVGAIVIAGCGTDHRPDTSTTHHDPASAASTSAHRTVALEPATADTTSGRLRGTTTSRARMFLGVRYARPPVGRLRWALPRPAPRATGTVDATRPGSPCPQAAALPGASSTASTNEDCLFLNVTTPRAARPGGRLPVMVWWHGGGFQSGAGAAYDAQRLASRGDAVVVTVNYRLGIFGYLGLPGLKGSGDFGLADQIAATQWAKTNARAFGGDPRRLTVFGESAGAMSACGLLTSPAIRGLATRVAMSSGSCGLDWPAGAQVVGAPASRPYVSLRDSQALGTSTAKALGCSGAGVINCMRKKPVSALLPKSSSFGDALAFGTPLLPEDPREAVRRGRFVDVPVISGGNRDEERAFHGGVQQKQPSTFTARTYPVLLRKAYGRRAAAVAHRYPLRDFASAALAFSTVTTDGSWSCPTLRTNQQLARRDRRVFAYEFADRDAPNVNGVRTPQVPQGAAHATDVPYLFDLGGKDLVRAPAQARLADRMIDAWTSFAKTGRPGGPDRSWNPLSPGSTRARELAPGLIRDVDLAARHHCDFWGT